MERYISEAAVVAEIKRRRDLHYKYYVKSGVGSIAECKYEEDRDILDFLDTLEIKEVDLEKIINDYFKDWKFDDELDIMVKPNNYSVSFTDLKEIAKHFYELGIKAQKGEKI